MSAASRSLELISKAMAVTIAIATGAMLDARAEDVGVQAPETASTSEAPSLPWWDRMIPPMTLTGDAGRVDLHGFGSWAFADTDGNPYLGGKASSAWDVISGGLLVNAVAFERLSINAQFNGDTREGNDNITIQRAFAQWTFADWLKLRGGRSPHPIGIFSEVLNVGTTRPFFDLPQGVYGPTGTTTLSYDGLGLTGSIVIADWELLYDVYGGEAKAKFAAPYIAGFFPVPPVPGSVVTSDETDTAGGRIQILPPIDGLTVGVSAFRGEIGGSLPGTTVERIVYGGQFEFKREAYSLRAEYYKQEADGYKTNADAAYVMGTIRPFALIPVGETATLLDRIEIAAQWNMFHMRRVDPGGGLFPVPTPKQLKNHDEWAVGLNYWFTPTFVARAEYHRIYDNIFAHDGATLATKLGPPRDLDNETQLVKVGLEFSF